MRKHTLSPFPYYGGKGRMADLIADMLNYKDTNVYIEPFGGACRTLLNKPPHQFEMYCDTSIGLCTFFEIVQNEKTCMKLQEQLLSITPSEITFWESLKYKAGIEQTLLSEITKALKKYVLEIKRNSTNLNVINEAKILRKAILNLDIESIICGIGKLKALVGQSERGTLEYVEEVYQMFWKAGETRYWDAYEKGRKRAENEQIKGFEKASEKEARIEKAGRMNAFGVLESLVEPKELNLEESLKLAAATFQTFYLSRDGMGVSYSESRGEDIKAYIRKIDELSNIGMRMKDVSILNNAWLVLDKELSGGNYLNNPNVMMYLDPSYLSVADKETGRKGGKNLGSVYDTSFGLKQHEKLVENIKGAKAKILVSNYDVEPYNNNLTEENGWHRYEYETKTTVGGARDNKRTEVLWYNY